MSFRKEWCCRYAEIWDEEESGPPCSICPMQDFEPNAFNDFCLERWRFLDVTGRDRGFGECPLREEAIDLHLTRYEANSPEIYEAIFQIEMELFSHKQKEEKKRQDREKRKNESSKGQTGPRKNYSGNVPRRTASLKSKRR